MMTSDERCSTSHHWYM